MWGGVRPPDASWCDGSKIWSNHCDHRMPSDTHQSFDEVDLSQNDLTSFKAWPVILDEALRLVAPLGVLTLTASDSRLGSRFEVMRRIYRWSDGQARLESKLGVGESNTFSVRLMHHARRRVSAGDLDVIVISDGKRPERIDRLIESVRESADCLSAYKIIVSTPNADLSGRCQSWGADCLLIDDSDHPSALIGLRKNLALKASTADTVLIIHDRYKLSREFVKNLQGFGSDFSVLICRQIQEDGERFPDLVTTASDTITSRTALVEYGDWNSGIYVNGGAVLAKRSILERVPWNHLLGWGQREDVEWTRRLRDAGYEPRLCRSTVLVTLPPRSGYLSHFEPSAPTSSKYAAPGDPEESPTVFSPPVRRKRFLRLDACDRGDLSVKSGLFLSPEWTVEDGAARLPASCAGTISFRAFKRSQSRSIRLVLWGTGVGYAAYTSSLAIRFIPIARRLGVLILPASELSGAFVKISVRSDAPVAVSRMFLC